MRATGPREKIFGLDLMRATAGVMVMVAHSSYLVEQHWPRFPAIPPVDWVNLFFVLSGYLIGGILLDSIAGTGTLALRLGDFMQRRWLRTLPNYYLFLLLNILLVRSDLAPGMLSDRSWAYVVFMQNFHRPLDLFFWESWSLAVEEWFYLLFPLIVFGAIASIRMRGERAFLLACTVFILAPVLARTLIAHQVVDGTTWSLWVRKLVVTRLDAPGMGMLAAWAARRWPQAWRSVRWPGFAVGLLVLLTLGPMRFGDAPGFLTIGSESVFSLAIALLLPLLSSWRSGGILTRPMRRLSLITYALYLANLPMLYLWGPLVPDPVAWVCALHYALFIGTTLGVSALVFQFWERPFMRLREPAGRWLKARLA